MLSFESYIPIYSIFIIILIISAGFLTELFPCKVRKLLTENIYLKHFFCYLTTIFFVVLTGPEKNKNLKYIIYKSTILYTVFIFAIKTHYKFFIAIIFLLGLSYLVLLKKYEVKDDIDKLNINIEKTYITQESNDIDKNNKKELEDFYEKITILNNTLFTIVILLIIIGFIIYMNEKKLEYKNKFNFITFLFGKPECKSLK